ncbi:MAG: hypothetical protein E4G94_10675 [ANME-2 cluster archaeon]|jgi:lysylphosphatidylglycerol synthetase-like protein (DUF2156 family)|nr:MAG: hypothetical protein E4G94_10675 [ANME-2 cluster archaeon]
MKQLKLGTALIATLYAIGGLSFIISAIKVSSMDPAVYSDFLRLAGVDGAMLGFLVFRGILGFALAYGIWNMTKWGWTATLIISGIGLVVGIISINIIGLIISSIIIWYLWTNKSDFGM